MGAVVLMCNQAESRAAVGEGRTKDRDVIFVGDLANQGDTILVSLLFRSPAFSWRQYSPHSTFQHLCKIYVSERTSCPLMPANIFVLFLRQPAGKKTPPITN